MDFGLIIVAGFVTTIAFIGIVAYDMLWASDVEG